MCRLRMCHNRYIEYTLMYIGYDCIGYECAIIGRADPYFIGALGYFFFGPIINK